MITLESMRLGHGHVVKKTEMYISKLSKNITVLNLNWKCLTGFTANFKCPLRIAVGV